MSEIQDLLPSAGVTFFIKGYGVIHYYEENTECSYLPLCYYFRLHFPLCYLLIRFLWFFVYYLSYNSFSFGEKIKNPLRAIFLKLNHWVHRCNGYITRRYSVNILLFDVSLSAEKLARILFCYTFYLKIERNSKAVWVKTL